MSKNRFVDHLACVLQLQIAMFIQNILGQYLRIPSAQKDGRYQTSFERKHSYDKKNFVTNSVFQTISAEDESADRVDCAIFDKKA